MSCVAFRYALIAALYACAMGLEPLALLATQPVWQAGDPMTVNVEYDGFCCHVKLECVIL